MVKEGRRRRALFSKMGSSTLPRSSQRREGGEPGKFASPLSSSPPLLSAPLPTPPFGAHGGNFSRATITLVADKSNVLINAHRHASDSTPVLPTQPDFGLRQSEHLRDLYGADATTERQLQILHHDFHYSFSHLQE